jgi:Tfp pilus assembly protein PilW
MELVVSMGMALVVLGATVTALVYGMREQARSADYSYAQSDARTGLDAMVSQIRQATNIVADGPNFIDFDVNLGGIAYQVYYECDVPQTGTSYNKCVRLQTTVGATLPALSTGTTVIGDVTNGTVANPVFTFAPDSIAPYYMTASVDVPSNNGDGLASTGGHTIVLSDGALMRNENVGN